MNKQTVTQHEHHPGKRPVAAHVAARKPHKAHKAQRAMAGVDPQSRHALIAEAAYYRAERRGFTPGNEIDDWLDAETEIENLLKEEMSS